VLTFIENGIFQGGITMNRNKYLLGLSVILLSGVMRVDAHEYQQEPPPPTYRMEVAKVFDQEATEFVFVIGKVAFKSVDSLKKFLSSVPPGSTLEWAPGCVRWGDEPLLSSDVDMQDFKAFCAEKNIKFVLVPSG
jgi:hypothetical protein